MASKILGGQEHVQNREIETAKKQSYSVLTNNVQQCLNTRQSIYGKEI